MNYVQLLPGVPKRVHFTDDYIVERDVLEKESGRTKRIKSRVFGVDEEDGVDVLRTLSVMSQKLDALLIPFLPDKRYKDYDFIITKMGDGFLVDWNVQTIKRQT